MALGVSSERVREVRFAEQWRGYRTEDVDDFVEEVAEAFDQLEVRVRETSQRAEVAERRLLDRGPDEDLSRTLVLAQRTADAARREAEAEAASIVAQAREQARILLEEAEQRRARLDQEIDARVEAELGALVHRRASLERDVAALAAFVEHERRRLAEELRTQLAWLERPGNLDPPSLAQSDSSSSPAPPPVPEVRSPEPRSPEDRSPEDRSPEMHPGDAPHREAVSDMEALFVTATDEAGIADSNEPVVPDQGAAQEQPATSDPEGTIAVESYGDAGDDTILDDLDVPWRASDSTTNENAPGAGDANRLSTDLAPDTAGDPFLAELRRAVDDPEPLGPRDDVPDQGDFGNERELYDKERNANRFRRRRTR